jgi:hypothetical protein
VRDSTRLDEPRRTLVAGARLLVGALEEIWKAIVAAAEAGGHVELRLARVLAVPLGATRRGLRATLSYLERVVTPARTVAAVVVCAALALAASQFVDYRGVEIGASLYQGVEGIAPPPQTDQEVAGSAHSYLMLPLAALVIVAVPFALRGRWQLGRAISVLGLVAIAVSLLVDMPKGFDEGLAARDFEGARATLLEGFWLQLVSACVLVFVGLLLSRYVRLQGAPARRRSRRPAGRPGRDRAAPAAGARA